MNQVQKNPVLTRIEGINYNKDKFERIDFSKIKDYSSLKDSKITSWINIEGNQNPEIIEKVCNAFGLHQLVIEDILSGKQRPKCEEYDDYLFVVLRLFYTKGRKGELASEQVSIIVGKSYVLSFQEKHSNIYDEIVERIEYGKLKLREKGPDYLAYTLLDVVVDNHFSIMEKVGEDIEELEEDLLSNPDSETLEDIYSFKQKIIQLRKSVWNLMEAVDKIIKNDSGLIGKQTKLFMRDVYDHTSRIIDSIETYRDMVAGMIELYSTKSSLRMNEIMKVLTVIATIFIPLTFITGIYGMNFRVLPEIYWDYGYFTVLIVMAVVAFGMLYYFKKKKWI